MKNRIELSFSESKGNAIAASLILFITVLFLMEGFLYDSYDHNTNSLFFGLSFFSFCFFLITLGIGLQGLVRLKKYRIINKFIILNTIILLSIYSIFYYRIIKMRNNINTIAEEIYDKDPKIQIRAFYKLYRLRSLKQIYGIDYSQIIQRKEIDCILDNCISFLKDDSRWSEIKYATEYYDILKNKLDSNLVIDSLVRHILIPHVRLKTLILSIKLGIPGSIEKLNNTLMHHGDVKMAEDFLNSGSPELHNCAEKWGKSHGYSISTGPGSHRAAWGHF